MATTDDVREAFILSRNPADEEQARAEFDAWLADVEESVDGMTAAEHQERAAREEAEAVEETPDCCVTGIHIIAADDLEQGDVLMAVQAWDYNNSEWYMRPIKGEPVVEKRPWRYQSRGRMAGDGAPMLSIKVVGEKDRWHWGRDTRVQIYRKVQA